MSEPSAAGPGCYVYRPSHGSIQAKVAEQRQQRQQQQQSKLTTTTTGITPERLQAFHRVWEPTQATLEQVVASADSDSVEQICSWLSQLRPRTLDRIPAGLVTTSTASSLFDKVSAHADPDILVISVPASACTNLKSVLKCIVAAASSSSAETQIQAQQQLRLLNYDLETLRLVSDALRCEKVLLYLGNGESLHGGVLSDLVDVLHSWRDRIPVVLVFETAVSVGLFQEKLTRRALRQLRGEPFSTASSGDVVEGIFRAVATRGQQMLWMGANPAAMLVERQAEHLQSAQAFVMAIKYMYMVHFYRSPLSVLLDNRDAEWTESMIEAARKLKSFQTHVDSLREHKKGKEATKLAKDKDSLSELVLESLEEGQKRLFDISIAVQLLNVIHEIVPTKTGLSWSRLYVLAMSGQLLESPTLRNLLLSVRAMPSDSMQRLLSRLHELAVPEIEPLLSQLSELRSTHADSGPLRSEHDQSLETTRTTVVAKKISLSKQKAALSKGDAEYSALVKRASSTIEAYLKDRLVNPKSLLFNEIFIFDQRVALREAFAPRPRHALEHALTVPGAYLACECCEPDERGISGTQPATSILYQLYLESGTIVNIADLWAAFEAVIQDQENGEDTMDEDIAVDDRKLALFYRSLAELNYLGMVKSSRKKADHLVKMRFLGL